MKDQTINLPLFYPVRTQAMEQAALDVIRSGQIASGPAVQQFELEFGRFIGRNHVVATNDMTSALVIALRLAGVKAGDDVATLAFSCLSSNTSISMVGAQAVWVDIDPATMSMCPGDLARKITPETKAVILYHVAGYPAPAAEIATICRRRGLTLIEDCNNAVGALIDGRQIGNDGSFAVYSFYPNRQINGFEGGAVVCPDAETSQHAFRLRRFGIDYAGFRDARGEINPAADVPEIGLSASFSQLNAAVALSQLPSLSERQRKVRANAERLAALLKDAPGLRLVEVIPGATPAYWCLLFHAERRDQLLGALKNRGIACSVLHQRNDTYTGFHSKNADLPGTAYVMDHLLGLPCGSWLEAEQIDHIAHAVKAELQG